MVEFKFFFQKKLKTHNLKPINFPLICIFALIFLCSNQSFAQYYQTIRGQITEHSTGLAIGGATVILASDSTTGAVSDAQGFFQLTNIAVGRVGIEVTMLGYKPLRLDNLLLTSGKELLVNVELEERIADIKEVVITGNSATRPNNELAAISARSFSVEEANRMAGNFGDVARQAMNYAGVGTGDDINNGIIVRGNSPAGVLWRLEGVDIPNPNHFSFVGTSGGYFTILNNNVTANSDFLTSAFPAEYGNKAGAVFDVKMKNGNNSKREWTAQIGLNGLELGAEGPIKRGSSSYIVHYRNFNLSVLKQAGLKLNFSGLPNFQDLNFKINIPTAKFGKFSVFGIGGMSSVALLESEKLAVDWTFSDRAEDIHFGSDMGVIGVSNTHFYQSNLVGRAYFALSGSRVNLLREWVSPNLPPQTNEEFALNEGKTTFKYDLTYKLDTRNLFRFGAIYSQINWDYNQKELAPPKFNEYKNTLKLKDQGGLLQVYAQLQHRFNEKTTLNVGVHVQNFLYNHSNAVEPRLALQYALAPKHTLAFGYGVHSQMQPLIFYSTIQKRNGRDTTTGHGLDFTRTQHLVLSYDWAIARKTRFKSEIYYQDINDAPITKAQGVKWFSAINSGSDYNFFVPDSLQNKGSGYNYGLELTFEQFFDKNYYFLTTFSLFDSKYKAADGIVRNTVFNNNFVWNVVGGYEFALSKNTALSLDTKLTLAGGRPYIPIDLDRSKAVQTEVYDYQNAYSQRFPLYYRWDVKASLRLNRAKISHFIYIGANNVLDSKNPLKQSFNKNSQTIVTEYMQGFLPVFGYRVQF